MRVVDYKTGKAPREIYEAKALFQMRFYALVLWRLHGRVPRMLQLLYLGSGEVLRYEPDEADLLATERKLGALWQAIAQAARTGDWRPSPGRLCDWCDHHDRCPAQGGTPPPLPRDATVEADADDERPSPHTPPEEV
jgi:putative RecB family exonuclease